MDNGPVEHFPVAHIQDLFLARFYLRPELALKRIFSPLFSTLKPTRWNENKVTARLSEDITYIHTSPSVCNFSSGGSDDTWTESEEVPEDDSAVR